MKKFDFSCLKSLSDDTFVFLIRFEKGCIVQDVIDLALSKKEWGTIYIVEEGGSRFILALYEWKEVEDDE